MVDNVSKVIIVAVAFIMYGMGGIGALLLWVGIVAGVLFLQQIVTAKVIQSIPNELDDYRQGGARRMELFPFCQEEGHTDAEIHNSDISRCAMWTAIDVAAGTLGAQFGSEGFRRVMETSESIKDMIEQGGGIFGNVGLTFDERGVRLTVHYTMRGAKVWEQYKTYNQIIEIMESDRRIIATPAEQQMLRAMTYSSVIDYCPDARMHKGWITA